MERKLKYLLASTFVLLEAGFGVTSCLFVEALVTLTAQGMFSKAFDPDTDEEEEGLSVTSDGYNK